MRKQTKLVAVLSAAALLAIGASMTSFAAAPHWDQQDNEWVYLDRNGDRVTDEWKKSNGQWYYLDSDGYMAREQVIEDDDDKYYVGADGARVTNTWISMDNDDLLDDDDASESIDTVWMYFDGTGKALGAGSNAGEIKRLTYGDNQNGYFIFNEDGYMLSGWRKWDKTNGENDDGDLYYLGGQNEGWATTGWKYLEVDTDLDVFNTVDTEDDNYTDEAYFYFQPNGKAYVDKTKSINGKYYSFDEWGRMLDLWVYPGDGVASDSGFTNNAASASSAQSGSAFYREGDGGREKDWVYAYPTSGYDNYDDDPYWFYLDSKGKPFKAATTAGAATRLDDDDEADAAEATYNKLVSTKKIKNDTYLFNNKGVMLTGLYRLDGSVKKNNGDAAQGAGIYYFTEDGSHSSVEGQMVTNKKVVIEIDDENETFYFDTKGKAYTNTIVSGYLYGYNGRLVDDYGDGNTYEKVNVEDVIADDGNGNYVISIKGKSTTYTLSRGDQILVNGNGKIKEKGRVTKDVDENEVHVENCIVTDTIVK